MSSFSFVVLGEPAPQGSKRGFLNKYTGKVVITEQVKRTRPGAKRCSPLPRPFRHPSTGRSS